MKFIFLDIDGVLNRVGTESELRTATKWHGYIGMEPELVKRFNKLVRQTKATVVLSSTWRLSKSWREDMKGNGLTCKFLDRTPYLVDDDQMHMPRGKEIKAWLFDWQAENPTQTLEAYAIIDDDSDFLPDQPLFNTDHAFGLTQEMADAIARHLCTA